MDMYYLIVRWYSSVVTVDVDTVVIVDVVAPYKQFTALLEKNRFLVPR